MTIPRTLRRPVLAAAAVAGAVSLVAAPAALAHDVVIGGDPADGEVVEEFPRSIELEFSGIPREGFSTVAVTDQATGELLYSGEPTIEQQWVILDLPEGVTGGPGDYTVGFQITSSDGHATRGMTTFTVAGEGTTDATDTAGTENAGTENAESGTDTDPATDAATGEAEETGLSGAPAWILGGLGVIVILGVIVMMIAKARNTPQE